MSKPLKNISKDKIIIKSILGEITPKVPFWFMRQAGRYLPEYMELRKKSGSFLDLCFNSDLATKITLQPIDRFDMDAAILFSDILVVPYAMGQGLSFEKGEGPKLEKFSNVDSFREIELTNFDKKLSPVYETIRKIKNNLAENKTLIGFAGAPWTVVCYMIQGYGDKEFNSVKKYAYKNIEDFDVLINILVEKTSHYLIQQIINGVDAIQIFDSWAGLLPEEFFERWVINPTSKIVENIHRQYPGFPIIGFPKGAGMLYADYAEKTGVYCVGLDQFTSMEIAIDSFGSKVTLQGNLDPSILLVGGKLLEEATLKILETTKNNPFIFNLGHGIIKETPIEHIEQLARIIKRYERL